MESDIMEKIIAVATYVDDDGKVQPGDRDIWELWKNTSLEIQKEKIIDIVKFLKTYIDENGEVKQGADNIFALWDQTFFEVQEEKIVEVAKLLATYVDENGKVKQGTNNILALGYQMYSEVEEEKLIELVQALATYVDENGKVKQGDGNIARLWNQTLPEVQEKKILEVIQTFATYVDETREVVQGDSNIASLWSQTPSEIQKEKILDSIKILAIYDENGQIQQGTKNIGELWEKTKPEVQKEKFLEILTYFKNTTYKDEFGKDVLQMRNFDKFLSITPKEIIEENYEEICKIIESYEDKSDIMSRLLCYSLPQYKDLSEEAIKKINANKSIVRVDFRQLNKIKGKIDKDVPIYLEIKDVSKLPLDKIEKLKSEGFNIQYVGFKQQENNGLSTIERLPYNIEKYKEIRGKIDELLEDVDKGENKLKILLQILQKICKQACYDYSAYKDGKYRYEKTYSSRNLEGALLEGACVCARICGIIKKYGSMSRNKLFIDWKWRTCMEPGRNR